MNLLSESCKIEITSIFLTLIGSFSYNQPIIEGFVTILAIILERVTKTNDLTFSIKAPFFPPFSSTVYHHYSVPTILQVVTRICF